MHKIKSQTAPKMFQNKFSKPTHKYPTNFSTSNYRIPPFKLTKSKYRISIRGLTLWKNFPINSEKMQASVTVFKRSMRKKLPKVFFEKVVLKLIVLSGSILWSSVIFFNCYIRGQWSLSFLHSTAGLFFSCFLCDILGNYVWNFSENASRTTLSFQGLGDKTLRSSERSFPTER